MTTATRIDNTAASGLSPTSWIAIALVVIGALNWGLVGIFDFNLVAAIFGSGSVVSRIIYILVALAGLYLIAASTRFRRPAHAL